MTAFDIETTRLPSLDQSVMYVWQFQIGLEYTVIGRYWGEFEMILQDIRDALDDKQTLVILVHNLSYEFVYLRQIYHFKPAEVFALKSRRVAKCTMYDGKIEFRCSYVHSNMSLAEYTKKMGVEHIKQSGEEYDYSKQRFPWTPLTEAEKRYCQYDVLGLVEAYTKEMAIDHDTLETVPMTSTGYVRRECKRAMRLVSHRFVDYAYPDEDLYKMLRMAFRGGDTHANRYYAGHILHDVKSADRSSSYPDVMCNCPFPITAFRPVPDPTRAKLDRYLHKGIPFIATIRCYGVEIIDPYYGFPYLAYHKCAPRGNFCLDNGRLLSAEYIETTITDIDYRIITETYSINSMDVLSCRISHYGPLPEPLILTTQQYYRRKTELKGVPGQEVYYTKSKNLLNSLYGMMAQDPVKQNILYLFDDIQQYVEDTQPIIDLLEKNRKRAFLLYQHGVYVTAWARYRLYQAIQIAGHEAVYVDTDSVKYIGDADFSRYNAQRIRDSKRTGSFATDPSGTTHYMGVMEAEKPYTRFITLGAKKYAYEYADGQTHVTVSGVNKRKGGAELHRRGGLEAFNAGFVFYDAGGTESIYNDFADLDIEVEGIPLHIGSNVCIKDSTYTISLTDDYERLLADPQLYKKLCISFGDFAD